jgi:hypothetical protein
MIVVRPSRRAADAALVRMRKSFRGIEIHPHPEEAALAWSAAVSKDARHHVRVFR